MAWNDAKLPRGFPLTRGKRGYFVWMSGRTRWVCGPATPKEALLVFDRKAPSWRQDEVPLPAPELTDGCPTLHALLGRWLLDVRSDAERGEIRPFTFQQYRLSAKRIDRIAGHLLTDDVSPDVVKRIYERLHEKHGADFARRAIGHFRACARAAEDYGWCRPMRIGNKLIAKLAARPKASMKWRLYTADELAHILAECDRRIREARGGKYREPWVQMKAMILLALNGGYGARELSELTKPVIDAANACIDFRRGKTHQAHVVPLWPETIAALVPVLAMRPDDELLFRTRAGNPVSFYREFLKNGRLHRVLHNDNVNMLFTELVKPLGLKISGSGFYKLKHVANTTADAAGDPHATFTLFGHALPGAKSHYVRVGLDRVRKVVEYMREHLILNRQASPLSAAASGAARRRGAKRRSGNGSRRRAARAAASAGR